MRFQSQFFNGEIRYLQIKYQWWWGRLSRIQIAVFRWIHLTTCANNPSKCDRWNGFILSLWFCLSWEDRLLIFSWQGPYLNFDYLCAWKLSFSSEHWYTFRLFPVKIPYPYSKFFFQPVPVPVPVPPISRWFRLRTFSVPIISNLVRTPY